mmetsp:Transcript_5794/g.12262  ORF Transcript_5794/g.12262 Transcript_5794/m.12262 type:complete len:289 (+) Transcript_5794:1271-2137(+)
MSLSMAISQFKKSFLQKLRIPAPYILRMRNHEIQFAGVQPAGEELVLPFGAGDEKEVRIRPDQLHDILPQLVGQIRIRPNDPQKPSPRRCPIFALVRRSVLPVPHHRRQREGLEQLQPGVSEGQQIRLTLLEGRDDELHDVLSSGIFWGVCGSVRRKPHLFLEVRDPTETGSGRRGDRIRSISGRRRRNGSGVERHHKTDDREAPYYRHEGDYFCQAVRFTSRPADRGQGLIDDALLEGQERVFEIYGRLAVCASRGYYRRGWRGARRRGARKPRSKRFVGGHCTKCY